MATPDNTFTCGGCGITAAGRKAPNGSKRVSSPDGWGSLIIDITPHCSATLCPDCARKMKLAFARLPRHTTSYPERSGDVIILGPNVIYDPIADVIRYSGHDYDVQKAPHV